MHDGRYDATATRLRNGMVLIAGGIKSFSFGPNPTKDYLASAELYDPGTGKFTRTGSMITPRSSATATLLTDGRVLIAGGEGAGPNYKSCIYGILKSAELYDPATGKFSSTGSMLTCRAYNSATRLNDGRVLVVGGYDAWAELYDPASGKFTRTGTVPVGPYNTSPHATSTLLPDGTVFVTAGDDSLGASLYDPSTGTFRSVPFARDPEGVASAAYITSSDRKTEPETATLLKNGRVLVYRSTGVANDGYLETYDPATSVLTPAGAMVPHGAWGYGPVATLLQDGRVLFTGTDVSYGAVGAASSAGIYDPTTGPGDLPSMSTAREGQTATLLDNGSVLVAGGTPDLGDGLASAELFKP